MKIIITVVFFFIFICISKAQENIQIDSVKNKLVSEVDSLDECGLHILLAPASQQFDSLGHFLGYRQIPYILNERINNLLMKNEKLTNKVLLDLLVINDKKISWSADIMLYNFNGLDGNNLLKFSAGSCGDWYMKQRKKDIRFWEKYKKKKFNKHEFKKNSNKRDV